MGFKVFNTTIGGLSGILTGATTGDWSAVGQGLLSGASQDYENYEAKAAAKRANEEQIAFWNMQNAYNSPVEQMKRLEEAGLNPMLVYGGGNVSGNSASAIGTAQSAGNKANYQATVQGIQALSNIKNTNANTNAQQANTLATYQDITNMQTANKIQQADLEQKQQDVAMGALDLEYAKKEQELRLKDLENRKAGVKRETVWNESGAGDIEYGIDKALDTVGQFVPIVNAVRGLSRSQAGFDREASRYRPRYTSRRR